MYSSIVELLGSVPDVIWSGVIASVLTLSGVLISIYTNTRGLKRQLSHDASEKAKERIANLRRDVYLEVAEELTKANAHLATLPQMDLAKGDFFGEMRGFFCAAAKLQLVGELKTTLLINKLSADYSHLLISVAAQIIPVGKAKSDIEVFDDLYSETQKEIKRVLADMIRTRESGKFDDEVSKNLQRSFDFFSEQSQKYADDRNSAWVRFNASQAAFHKFLLIQLRGLVPRSLAVVAELRRDLGLTGNIDELEAQVKSEMQRMEQRFDELLARLGVD